MIRSRGKKFLIVFGTILVVCSILLNFTGAEDLDKVVKKKDIHPKISSHLWQLEKGYVEGTMSAQVYDQDMITVFLFSEPGTNIDEYALQAYGAEIIKGAGNVRKAKLPTNMIETIADNVEGISFIKLPDRPKLEAIESQGVELTGASTYQSAGYAGAGVKVAVIDSFAGLSDAIFDGELPNTVNKIDCTGETCIATDFSSETSKHGTAVAEIIYDMAPDAELYLIKYGDRLDLKTAKDYCIANGIKVINFSVGYYNTNFYDGECYDDNPVCTANDAYDNGILWVKSMGNSAQRHYGATFTDSTDHNQYHDQTITIEVTENDFNRDNKYIVVFLTWNDWPRTDQDYDLYLCDSVPCSSSNWIKKSDTVQSENAKKEPTEFIVYEATAAGNYYLVVHQYEATKDHRLAVYSMNHDLDPAVAQSSLTSPADAEHVMAVGAINYQNWTTGPTEPFSSQGPTNDDRIKPDISGPDGVANYCYGAFYGTSAASPHVAGAAALILSNNRTYSVQELWNALASSAVDMGSSGQDNIYGYGRLNLPPVHVLPIIKANGSEGPIAISTLDSLSVTVAMKANNLSSKNCDWWCAAQTPWGWYCYDYEGNQWIEGLQVTYMGPCVDIITTEVLSMKLPAGEYTFYFGVDTAMNGSIDMSRMYYDSVDVSVTDASGSAVGTWSMNYDWNCNGSFGTTSWYLHGDGTFNTSANYSGTWTQIGNEVEFVYTSGTRYTGIINPAGAYMSGFMVSHAGSTGCWDANRTATGTDSLSGKESPDSDGS